MNFCGFRSISGNHELWICTMIRCPSRQVCAMSGRRNVIVSGFPGSNGTGFSKLLRNFPRNGSPRINSWYPPIFTAFAGPCAAGGLLRARRGGAGAL